MIRAPFHIQSAVAKLSKPLTLDHSLHVFTLRALRSEAMRHVDEAGNSTRFHGLDRLRFSVWNPPCDWGHRHGEVSPERPAGVGPPVRWVVIDGRT